MGMHLLLLTRQLVCVPLAFGLCPVRTGEGLYASPGQEKRSPLQPFIPHRKPASTLLCSQRNLSIIILQHLLVTHFILQVKKMKCSISAGHSCNVIRVAIIQNGGQLKKGKEAAWCCLGATHPLPATGCSRSITVMCLNDGVESMSGFSTTLGTYEHRQSWDEINYGPEVRVVNSRFTLDTCHSCLSLSALQPSLK